MADTWRYGWLRLRVISTTGVTGPAPALKIEARIGDIPDFVSSDEGPDAYLRRVGREGWELAGVSTVHDEKGAEHLLLFFKQRTEGQR